jgi:tRNA(fMet)-specific endonuclease VapC
VILDTNALSAYADGARELAPVIRAATPAVIPVIVLGEYRYGIAHSSRRPIYEAWLDEVLGFWVVLEISEETSRWYAEVRSGLRRIGATIPSNDAWIAALARQHRLPVLSRDLHFDRVPGLRRIGW